MSCSMIRQNFRPASFFEKLGDSEACSDEDWVRRLLEHFGTRAQRYDASLVAKYVRGRRKELALLLSDITKDDDVESIERQLLQFLNNWIAKSKEHSEKSSNGVVDIRQDVAGKRAPNNQRWPYISFGKRVPAEEVEEKDEATPLKKKLKSITMPNVTVLDLILGRSHKEFCMVKAVMEPFTEDIHPAAKSRIRHRAETNLLWVK